jgi:hypothetical protein
MLQELDPVYVSAILNHPLWRLNTFALSAGKRQDNISQATLANIIVPSASSSLQNDIASEYRQTLAKIAEALRDDRRFKGVCDEILRRSAGVPSPPARERLLEARRVNLSEVAATSTQRIDNRWHGVANTTIRGELLRTGSIELGQLFAESPCRGKQPAVVDEDDPLTDDSPIAFTASKRTSTSFAGEAHQRSYSRSVFGLARRCACCDGRRWLTRQGSCYSKSLGSGDGGFTHSSRSFSESRNCVYRYLLPQQYLGSRADGEPYDWLNWADAA